RLALPAPKPIRRLSNNEARERREKGLCCYCDDKYTPGHKCSKPQFFMIGDAEETENENPTNDALETPADEVQGEISFHAISGTILPQTLRLPERIQNKDMVVLVDGGSTHNFVDQESPMTYVPALSPVSGALSPFCTDLIPSPKRVRDFGYLVDVEFEDYNFTLEDLGIPLDPPAEPVIQSESNRLRESKTAHNNVCKASKSEVDVTGISNDDMFDIDEFHGVIDGFDFDFLDTQFEDYNFTLEDLAKILVEVCLANLIEDLNAYLVLFGPKNRKYRMGDAIVRD
nr:transposon Ty3-G Gag-Pol polyprotein [Tanacetum cinerariifolium]